MNADLQTRIGRIKGRCRWAIEEIKKSCPSAESRCCWNALLLMIEQAEKRHKQGMMEEDTAFLALDTENELLELCNTWEKQR